MTRGCIAIAALVNGVPIGTFVERAIQTAGIFGNCLAAVVLTLICFVIGAGLAAVICTLICVAIGVRAASEFFIRDLNTPKARVAALPIVGTVR